MLKTVSCIAALCLVSAAAQAQSAADIRGPIALAPIDNEAAPRLIVDPPHPGALARGAVVIQYRTEHLRILPVYGKEAARVSPRIGHLHVTVDDTPWHWADASDQPIILTGFKPGPHKVLLELADATHKVLSSQTVEFIVPETRDGKEHKH